MSLYSREFFKIMQNHELQEGELRVPKTFVKIHWKGISNPILLTLPNGVDQKIYWVERDGDIWLHKTWKNFAESLKYGYALAFKYLGGSHFKVKIFSSTTLQIDYSNIKFVENSSKQVEASDDDCIEISHKSEQALIKKRKKSKKTDFNSHDGGATTSRSIVTRKRKNNMGFFDAKVSAVVNRGIMTKKAKGDKNSHPDENPSFKIQLSPSYVQGSFLRIPSGFSKKYLRELGGTSATINSVGEKRTWEVNIKVGAGNGNSIFSSGWKSFAEDNNLQVHDVCKFEMVQREPVLFRVTITRATEEPCPHQLQDSEGRNVKQYTFKISVTSSSYSNIPNAFLKRHSKCHGKFVELKVGETYRAYVKVLHYKDFGFGRFSEGWAQFVRECELKIGDTCVFEMIDEENLVFKVSIERHNHY